MKILTAPGDIWREHEKAQSYNTDINLSDNVKKNEDFYIGNQWVGVNAPDIDHPVLNFIQRVVSYFVSMIVSDDIAVALSPFDESHEHRSICTMLENEIGHVIEHEKAKSKGQMIIRNSAVDGDGCFYLWFDADDGDDGEIKIELLDNTKVEFGNPYVADAQKQPYIMLIQRLSVDAVKDMMKAAGEKELDAVRPDTQDFYGEKSGEDDLVTVIIKLYKQGKTVWFTKVTKEVVVQKPTDTGIKLYPIAWMNWMPVKNSYHGHAAITGLIPNQIFVNKLWAMAMEHQKRLAFPKLFYDMTKVHNWTNRVGEAIGVAGDPNTAVATTFRAADMSGQVLAIVEKTINYTRDFMGASDAALGNVKPENTSAIIAVQKASSAPLELQRMAYYQFWEDTVLIIMAMIKARYGKRDVYMDMDTPEGTAHLLVNFDFGSLNFDSVRTKVDVGASSYWSEIVEAQTADAMFKSGIITDAVTYLEAIPNGYIRNKNGLIEKLRVQQQMAMNGGIQSDGGAGI